MVDSSVAVKWFTLEPRHELAKAILNSGDELVAPVIAHAEIANALWRKVRTQEMAYDQAKQAISELPKMIDFVTVSPVIVERAFELVKELDHSVYDCIFLSTSLQMDGYLFLTDDAKFAQKAAIGGYGDKILSLKDGPIPLAFSDGQLGELLRLFEKSRETIEFVASQLYRPHSGLRITRTSDLEPAYASPVYVRLHREVSRLTAHQAAVLLAITWLGRGYDGDDFGALYSQASHLASAPSEHADYIITQIGYLSAGIARYQFQHTQTS